MNTAPDAADAVKDIAERVARDAQRLGRAIAAAESVTAGAIAVGLAAAPQASTWFRGSLVAYSSAVKHGVLGVDRGPVITAHAAVQMARGAARLLDADIAVATTGAGGPDPEEGQPAGTVFIAVCGPNQRVQVDRYRFSGGPEEVVKAAAAQALRDLSAFAAAEQRAPADTRPT
jgi:nicotinamide-nucleotide amidase